jgi:hypothetical protein
MAVPYVAGGSFEEKQRPSSSNTHSILWSMSTQDQLLYSALHGTAMRYAAERRNLDESIEELRQVADSRNDILAEAAGITAGFWYSVSRAPAAADGQEALTPWLCIAVDRV